MGGDFGLKEISHWYHFCFVHGRFCHSYCLSSPPLTLPYYPLLFHTIDWKVKKEKEKWLLQLIWVVSKSSNGSKIEV